MISIVTISSLVSFVCFISWFSLNKSCDLDYNSLVSLVHSSLISFSQFAEDDRLAAVFVVGYSLAGKDITLLPQDVLKLFFL